MVLVSVFCFFFFEEELFEEEEEEEELLEADVGVDSEVVEVSEEVPEVVVDDEAGVGCFVNSYLSVFCTQLLLKTFILQLSKRERKVYGYARFPVRATSMAEAIRLLDSQRH